MAFPVNPVNGQLYTTGGITYQWSSARYSWTKVATTAANIGNVIISNTSVTANTATSTAILDANLVTVSNTASSTNTAITSNVVTIAAPTSNTAITSNTIAVSNVTSSTNTAITSNTVTVSNPTSNTAITSNVVTVSNTASNTNTAITSNTVTVSNATSSTNTAITSNVVTIAAPTSNTAITSNTVTVSNTASSTNTAIASDVVTIAAPTSNTAITSNTVTVSNATSNTNTAIASDVVVVSNPTSNTSITSNVVTISVPTSNTAITSNTVTVSNSTSNTNTAITSDVVVVSNPTSNTSITSNVVTIAVPTSNTAITSNTIAVSNSTSNTNTAITSNVVVVSAPTSNTSITSDTIIVGNTTSNTTVNIDSVNTTLFTGNTITVSGNTTSGNANLGNLAIANYFVGNGSGLSGIQGSNVSGQVANALIAGTVYTNAQPNITSVGSLTGLTISNTTGIVDFSNTANISLGNISNLHISGGTSGYLLTTNGSGNLSWASAAAAGVVGNVIPLGTNVLGNLVSNAVALTTSTSVTDGITQLNTVLGKLVPPSPPNFPASQSITVASLSTYRMTNYVQTDNTATGGKSVAGGTTVSTVRRASSYSVNTITTAGPGDTGTIAVKLNGTDAGNRALTTALDGNGTYSNLIITNNYDYNNANANIAAGFWSVFSATASGTVPQGWNEVYISDSAASNTNTYTWFYDSSAPGTPAFSSASITAPVSPSYTYSSTVPHYDNTNAFGIAFNVNKLSGNMYPTSDTFATGSAGGAFGAPTSVTYAGASITTPLAQNLYVSSGNASVSTTSTIISGFGASSTGPQISVTNSYNTGTNTFTPSGNVLYKTGTTSSATRIEEANVYVGSSIGSGSGLAFRIENPGSGNTPVYTGSESAFNSQSSTLQTYDSTVVANVLKHDQTNYATGYLPAGPNLSSGRTGTQYFTFKIIRTSVSKFDVKWSGNIAGLWVALPGSTIDTTSSANGWINMAVAYAGAGIPGVNTPGNGSDGCALGGIAPLNSVQTNKSVTATFGTVSSSSTATNEIYVRVALTSGQSVTALSLQTASN